jgi:hypothetical protein
VSYRLLRMRNVRAPSRSTPAATMPAMAPPERPPLSPDFEVGAGVVVVVVVVVLVVVGVEVLVVVGAVAAVAWKATTRLADGASRRPSPRLGVGK